MVTSCPAGVLRPNPDPREQLWTLSPGSDYKAISGQKSDSCVTMATTTLETKETENAALGQSLAWYVQGPQFNPQHCRWGVVKLAS